MKDKDQPIKDIQEMLRNWRMNFAGSGVSALIIGIIILIVSLTIIPIVNQIYNDYHNINKLSKVAKEKEEEFDELQQERNLDKLSQDYDKYLKRNYAITEDLKYRNGITIPTFYKYVTSYRLVDYEILIETNEVAENNSVLKLYYDHITESDLKIYTDALIKKEGYENISNTDDKMIFMQDFIFEDKNVSAYIIIEKDCFTYGMIEEDK